MTQGGRIRSEDRKTEIFEQMPVPKAVLQLTVPTMLSSVVMILYNLADTYYVSMLNDPVQNAAVTLSAPVLLAFYAVNNLFGVGSSSMLSRALGSRDYETAYRSSAFGFYCALGSGLLFSLLYILFHRPLLTLLGADSVTAEATAAYMRWTVACGAVPSILNVILAYLVRAEGATLAASIGTMGGCVLNMILDTVFVLPWGLGMGAEGAGLATFLSNCISCLYFILLIRSRRGRSVVCLDIRKFSFEKKLVSSVFSVGFPAAIQNLLNVTGMTILNNLTAGYGADAVAAMGISEKINSLPVDLALGFTQGLMPLIGYNYASGNRKRMKETIVFSGKAMTIVMVAVAAVVFVMSGSVVSLFTRNETIIAYGARFLRGFCLALPFLRMDFFAVSIFQSVGIGRMPLFFAVLRKVVMEIPALFLLNHLAPLYGLAYAQFAAEVVVSLTAMVALKRLFKQLGC